MPAAIHLPGAVRAQTMRCSGPEVRLPCCASAEGKQSSVPVGRKVNSTPCGLGWDRSGMGKLGIDEWEKKMDRQKVVKEKLGQG